MKEWALAPEGRFRQFGLLPQQFESPAPQPARAFAPVIRGQGFVTGHDFSRAETEARRPSGFSPCGKLL